jgi:hypothetical protein
VAFPETPNAQHTGLRLLVSTAKAPKYRAPEAQSAVHAITSSAANGCLALGRTLW